MPRRVAIGSPPRRWTDATNGPCLKETPAGVEPTQNRFAGDCHAVWLQRLLFKAQGQLSVGVFMQAECHITQNYSAGLFQSARSDSNRRSPGSGPGGFPSFPTRRRRR
jgi:hypothetical protein